MESQLEIQCSESFPVNNAGDSQPKALGRKLCKWNAFVYLVFQGTEEEKTIWRNKIAMLEPNRNPTMSEIAVAYRDLSDEDLASLQRKAEDIQGDKAQPVEGLNRTNRAKQMVRTLRLTTSQIFAQLGWNVAVFLSSPHAADGNHTEVITNSAAAHTVAGAMGGRETFNRLCAEYHENPVKAGPALTRGQTRIKSELKDDVLALYNEKAKRKRTQKPRTSNDWSGFKRIEVDGEIRYRHEVACLDMVVRDDENETVDFGTEVAPNLSSMSSDHRRLVSIAAKNNTLFTRFDIRSLENDNGTQIDSDAVANQ